MILKLNNNNGKSVMLRVRVVIHVHWSIKIINVVDVTFAVKFGTFLMYMYVMHSCLNAN